MECYAVVFGMRNGMLLLDYSTVQVLNNVKFVEIASEISRSRLCGPTMADALIS